MPRVRTSSAVRGVSRADGAACRSSEAVDAEFIRRGKTRLAEAGAADALAEKIRPQLLAVARVHRVVDGARRVEIRYRDLDRSRTVAVVVGHRRSDGGDG